MSIEEVVEILKMHRNAFAAEHSGSAITALDIAINTLSAPHEMTARELLHIELRLFGKYLEAWDEYSDYVVDGKVEEAVQFAETWAREHTEEANDER